MHEQLTKTETSIQKSKSYQENIIKQKKQLEDQLTQSQINFQQMEQEKALKHDMLKALIQAKERTSKEKNEKAELKAKLEKENTQLEQKLANEKQIRTQLSFTN